MKKRVLNDEELERRFDDIEKKLKNAELKNLRECLLENQSLLAELSSIEVLKKKFWLSYLATHKAELEAYSEVYRASKDIIQEVTEQARAESTDWAAVVETFNSRFSVPFNLSIQNQEEVILKGSAPEVKFTFADRSNERVVDESQLLQVLSQGEKRALYILNILFELHVREKEETQTYIVVDDIADSFDYKNKYCIVQYLKEMAGKPFFEFIFLTHNYDFHRTVSKRLQIP